jgi:hypothetical protein
MMFTKHLVVVDDDVDVHNTSDVLFRLCANTDPQRDSMVAVRKDSPKARPTCSTTPPVPRLRDQRRQTRPRRDEETPRRKLQP